MDRISVLKELPEAAEQLLSTSFRYALVACLTPEEACRALDRSFEERYQVRRTIINKIIKDIAIAPSKCHFHLIKQLLTEYSELPYNGQKSSANVLIHLTEQSPELGRSDVIQLLISQSYVPIRRQIYSSLRRQWFDGVESSLSKAWDRFRDPECLTLLLKFVSVDWLQERLTEILEVVRDGRLLSKVFIRLGQSDPRLLPLLYEKDAVAYVYACAKLGEPVDDHRLRSIYEATWHTENQSLVVWCIGQLKRWDLLLELHRQSPPPFSPEVQWG